MGSKPIFAARSEMDSGTDPWCNGNTTGFGPVI